jgi:hypothetical protein
MNLRLERWSWAFITLGALGVVVTSGCYVLSADALALPIPPHRLAEALAAVERPHVLLWIGGNVGVMADVVFAAGAFGLALNGPRGVDALGWVMAGISATIFTVVDGWVGHGLEAGPGFATFKALFDVLFVAGTFSFGLATVLIFWPHRRARLARASLLVGALGIAAATGALWGADVGPGLGVSIGLGVVLFAAQGARRWLQPGGAQAWPPGAAASAP